MAVPSRLQLPLLPVDVLTPLTEYLSAKDITRLFGCGSLLLNRKFMDFGGVKRFVLDGDACLKKIPLILCQFRQLHTLSLSIYTFISLSNTDPKVAGALMPETLAPISTLKELAFWGEIPTVPAFRALDWINFTYYFPTLETLTVHVTYWSWKCAETFPATLRTLQVYWRTVYPNSPSVISLPPSLTRLTLDSYFGGSQVRLTSVPSTLSEIYIPRQVLFFIWNDLETKMPSNCNALTKVVLRCGTAQNELEVFAKCPNLSSITLLELSRDHADTINATVWPPSLTELFMTRSVGLNEFFFANLPPRLSRLSLVARLTPTTTSAIYRFPSSITDLAYRTSMLKESIIESDFQYLLSAVAPLNLVRFVNRRASAYFTDEAVAQLPSTLTRLDVVPEFFDPWFSSRDHGFSPFTSAIFSVLPSSLTSLNIPGYRGQIRCREAKLLPRTLTHLCARSSPFISPVAISHLPCGLRDLEIVYSRYFREAHFAALPKGVFSLKVGIARKVAPESFALLPTSLRKLTIMNWAGASDTAIAHLPRDLEYLALPGLQTRSIYWTQACLPKLPPHLKSLHMSFSHDWKVDALDTIPKTLTKIRLILLRGPNRLSRNVLPPLQLALNRLSNTTHPNLKNISITRNKDLALTFMHAMRHSQDAFKAIPTPYPWPHFRWMYAEHDDTQEE